jgi:hypothetical protein
MAQNDQAGSPAVDQDPQAGLLEALGEPSADEADQAGDEADENDDDAQDADEGGEQPPEVSQKFRVKIKNEAGADEERDLTLEELASGYMQSADYTRKTQTLSRQEQERQSQFLQAVTHTAEQARGQLRSLHQFVMSSVTPELRELTPELAATDPARFVALQAKQMQVQNVLGAIAHQDAQLQQQQQAALKQHREQSVRNSLEYLSKEIPGFNLEKDYHRLVEGATKYGYGDDLPQVSDGRFVHMLHDALKWRELQLKKPEAMKKVNEAPKVIKPSSPQPKRQNQAAAERLKQTGSPKELVHFL